jgi:hypothetical protein
MSPDCVLLNRRQSIVIGTSFILSSSRAFAQEGVSYETFSPLIGNANSVLDLAISIDIPYIHGAIPKYLDWDYNSRFKTLSAAGSSGVFANAESAISYVRALPKILPAAVLLKFDAATTNSQIFVIKELTRLSLPIVPPAESVAPAIVASVPDQSTTKDTDLRVISDIFLETLGIMLGEDTLTVAFIESDERLKQTFSEMLDKVASKDWKDVAELAEAAFKLFVGGTVWKTVTEKMAKKVTFGLALRCVPVVGWIYCTAALVVSIKKNYHRFSFAK